MNCGFLKIILTIFIHFIETRICGIFNFILIMFNILMKLGFVDFFNLF